MFQLTADEFKNLKFRFGTSSWGGTRKLSSVLSSKRAIQVNIQIMRTFTKIREMLATHKELRLKIEEMEKKYDAQFKVIFDAIRQLMEPPKKAGKRIGF